MALRPGSTVVRAPNWIGDAVMSMPFLKCLRENDPDGRITLVAKDSVLPVYECCPWIDDVMPIAHGGAGLGAMLGAVARVRERGFDVGFLLPNSFRSALLFVLAGVPRRVGYRRDGRSILLTRGVDRPTRDGRFQPTYMADYYLRLAEAEGLRVGDRYPRLFIDDAADARAAAILSAAGLDPGGGFILLSPGASFGPAKLWPTDRFARLADLLQAETGRQIAVISGPPDRPTADEIRRAARSPIVDLTRAGIDLHHLKGVVRRCGLLVTTDSGPRHYGIAYRRPTVCVMGPNHPEYSTTDLAIDCVVRVDVACGPCQKKICPRDHCCMTRVTPEMILASCRGFLA